jgi:hypothetical protein
MTDFERRDGIRRLSFRMTEGRADPPLSIENRGGGRVAAPLATESQRRFLAAAAAAATAEEVAAAVV